MKTPIRVLHLLDEVPPDHVRRMVDLLCEPPPAVAQAGLTIHHLCCVKPALVGPETRDADLIVSHVMPTWRGLSGLIALRAAHRDKKMIHVEHHYSAAYAREHREARQIPTLLRLTYSLFDQIVTLAGSQRDWLVGQGMCPPGKITMIPACTDLEPFRRLPSRPGPVRDIAAIGPLTRQSGFDRLITAFRSCARPGIGLHLFGEGPDESRLRALAAHDRNIFFRGANASPAGALSQTDLLVLPSRWDPSGVGAIEALSAGRRVLCAAIDGLRDQASLGAVLYPAERSNGLSRALARQIRQPGHNIVSACRYAPVMEKRFLNAWGGMVQNLCCIPA